MAVDQWLDQMEMTRLEQARQDMDLSGWGDSAPRTFDGGGHGTGAPWSEGPVTAEDGRIAAGIRERVRARRGVEHSYA